MVRQVISARIRVLDLLGRADASSRHLHAPEEQVGEKLLR